MKAQPLQFNQIAATRIYNDYMKRVRVVTRTLPAVNQEDICMELNSHIYEAIRKNEQAGEVNALLDILERLGAPEEVLRPLVADKQLERATSTFNPLHVFKALALNITNGISYIIFMVLYLLLSGFVFLIVAKLVNPTAVGMFYKYNSFMVLGMTNSSQEEGVKELLGPWFIPAMLLAIVIFYVIITTLLKIKKAITR